MDEQGNSGSFSLPRYEHLPDIGLYMDQVIALTDRSLCSMFGENSTILTASMVNNYVKQKLIPPPVKKRYNREHVACLITICILKQVMSIPEIASLLKLLFPADDFARGYNRWCEILESAFDELNGKSCAPAQLAALSVAGKSLFQKSIS